MNEFSTDKQSTSQHKSVCKFSNLINTFSPFEKLFFIVLLILFVGSTINVAHGVNKNALVEVPSYGGFYTEGILGSPRFINPLLAQSDADRDLTALLYGGLMRATPEGSLTHEIAKTHTISEDGLVYAITLRDDVTFHDGEKITADDVVYTIKMVQNPAIKSPKRGSWEGVLVEKVNDTEVLFTLSQPYAPFVENLTLGILPEHIWSNVSTEEITFSEFNSSPVGSGPYKLGSIKRDDSGFPIYYNLEAFEKFSLGKPYLNTIRFYFYPNEDFLIDAYINNDVNAINSISANNLAYARLNTDDMNIKRVTLPRIFGVFFNQNQVSAFSHIEVRKALNVALDKEKIIKEVLEGYATEINSPIPPGVLPEREKSEDDIEDEKLSQKKLAIDILERNGWEVNEESGAWEKETKEGLERLEFSISTSNIPELKAVAEMVKAEWESIGAIVTVKIFETGDLNQNVIRPRKYDALLFGEIVGRELDLFAFWHSSQRNDPGLNIALYANITADAVLEKARTLHNPEDRLEKFKEFEDEIYNDIPAVFIYSPDFIYVIPNNVKGIKLGSITTPSERFLNVNEWYTNTDNIWSFFVKNN